jgi:hypothetical protein
MSRSLSISQKAAPIVNKTPAWSDTRGEDTEEKDGKVGDR